MMIKWLFLASIFLAPVAAEAAQTATAVQFASVLQNPGHRQLVMDSAKQTPAWTHISCSQASFAQAPEVGVYVPVLFDKTGNPISGEWREGIIANGCGAPITLNVLTQITASATLATGFLLPGTTIADPVLQNYAQGFALKAVGGVPSGCKAGYIANTEFVGYEGAAAPQKIGPWKEIWTLALCSPPRRVVMHFIPDASGTTINAQPE